MTSATNHPGWASREAAEGDPSKVPEHANDVRIYEVRDGQVERHTVFAESPTLALAMWEIYMREECGLNSCELDVGADLPTVVEVSPEQARALRFTCEDEGDLGTLWDEYMRDPSRRHLSCSEC